MVLCTQALAIGKLEFLAAVAQFDFVIGIHSVDRPRFRAALAILNPFTSTARPTNDRGRPGLVSWGSVMFSALLSGRMSNPGIQNADARG